MANALVCCGGTGAHVALAFMRLHALGHALGFFRKANGAALDLPTIYLVDQDSGDGEEERTAWQEMRRILDAHPSRDQWGGRAGQTPKPACRVVTPLPVGADRNWFNPPRDVLEARFDGSPYLPVLTSPAQRDIRFSNGMMGSPAIGSLLFQLKNHDRRADGSNFDDEFERLLHEAGRVVVAGSGVGGTGAAVVPTLATELGDRGANVMAVMVLNWFEFTLDGLDAETARKSRRRNRIMTENAGSALQYYGGRLSEKVASVPVGVPQGALVGRRYTADTRQPKREAYPQGVAALCGMAQFLAESPYLPGLYYMGAESPNQLGGGTEVAGGTLQGLANQGATLANTLRVFAKVLKTGYGKRLRPALHAAYRGNPTPVGHALDKLVDDYDEHLAWMRDALGVEAAAADGFTIEHKVRSRLRSKPLDLSEASEAAAGEVMRWTAEWIHDNRSEQNGLVPAAGGAGGVHWPSFAGQEGLGLSGEAPGKLTAVPAPNVAATLSAFVKAERVSENGWPDPVAAADYFRYAIRAGDPSAIRQLELLLAGFVAGKLELREVHAHDGELSLEQLVKDARNENWVELAKHVLVQGETVVGFNSPHTLFGAVPGLPDDIWNELMKAVSDQSDWRSPNATWRDHGPVGGIRTWVEALKRRHPTEGPAWTRVFQDVRAEAPYGTDRKLRVHWGREVVEILLPRKGSGEFVPDPHQTIEAADYDDLWRTPAQDDAGISYRMVEFETPGRDEPIRGIWREHFETLQRHGEIVDFGANEAAREVYVCVLSPEREHRAVTLADTVLLDRRTMIVPRITPMRQDPVDGSAREPLYPDLPLRPDYIGLVEVPDRGALLALLKAGQAVEHSFEPKFERRAGGTVATWALPVQGRSKPLPFTVEVPDEESFHKAHWMVWPRFRARAAPFWRAYYVYEHCTDARLHLDTLWLDPDGETVHKACNENPDDRVSYPVLFDAVSRRHEAGPPLAFSLRNTVLDEEQGIYLARLQSMASLPDRVQVGVDFGTSHTVVAVAVGNDKPRMVDFAPELGEHGGDLSRHLSQNRAHVDAAFADSGLLSLGVWLPTYMRSVAGNLQGLLPSELLAIDPLQKLKQKDVSDWRPATDVVIPPIRIARQDVGEHVIADFKWNTSADFRGQEARLREMYLDMAVELAMAEIVDEYGRPESANFTFTYPLRTPPNDVANYKEMLEDVLKRASTSLGIRLGLTRNVGLFDESHAARGGTDTFGDVCVVGDLGGGTLDMLISAYHGPGVEFEDMADSVRLGGNLLLAKLAADDGTMPEGWGKTPEVRETHLRSWMRSKGSPRLFGADAGESPRFEELGLRGFPKPADAGRARELIDRYFYLIVEFMARNLVAYLKGHWHPKVAGRKDPPDPHVMVYLRGNGWRLWPHDDDHAQIEREIGNRVKACAARLWDRLGESPPPARWSFEQAAGEHPKRGAGSASRGQVATP